MGIKCLELPSLEVPRVGTSHPSNDGEPDNKASLYPIQADCVIIRGSQNHLLNDFSMWFAISINM